MSAVAQAIKNLGGSLDLESQEGKGSKFIFELPVV
jgi:chemotaxis protein histidine kinase CheA